MPTGTLQPKDELPNLDLLRSIAVLLVVVEHTLLALRIYTLGYWQIGWLGIVGVFMFFVHTSLVLMWSLDREPNTLGFYTRRFFRIYPLAIATVLITVAFRIPTMQNPLGDTFFQSPGVRNIISNVLLVQNLGWRGNILGVMWTLPIEVDMYFLLPFLFFFLRKNFAVWPILALWVAAAGYGRANFPPDNSSFVVCIPYFLPGIMAYVLFAKLQPRLPAFLMPVLIAVLLSLFMIHPAWRLGWCLTLILGLSLPLFRQIRTKWLIKASHNIAKYSYGIYLIHPFSIALAMNAMRGYNPVIRFVVLIVSMVAIVVPAYHFLEKPLIVFGAKFARRKRERQEDLAPMTAKSAVAQT